jgi:hypothetical protein
MNLVEEFTLTVALKPPLPVGDGPIGTRMYFDVASGEITGKRVKAKLLGGGEWALVGPDGFLRPDVRLQAETQDGAYLYIQYSGLLSMNESVQSAMANGTGTEYEDQYWYTNPRMETGDPRYAWLNTTFFVAQGRILPNLGVEYRVWRPA